MKDWLAPLEVDWSDNLYEVDAAKENEKENSIVFETKLNDVNVSVSKNGEIAYSFYRNGIYKRMIEYKGVKIYMYEDEMIHNIKKVI